MARNSLREIAAEGMSRGVLPTPETMIKLERLQIAGIEAAPGGALDYLYPNFTAHCGCDLAGND